MEPGAMESSTEAREFLVIKIYMQKEETVEPRTYRNGEFWIAGDLLFVSHDGPDEKTRKLKMFNIGWVKQVSLTYGV